MAPSPAVIGLRPQESTGARRPGPDTAARRVLGIGSCLPAARSALLAGSSGRVRCCHPSTARYWSLRLGVWSSVFPWPCLLPKSGIRASQEACQAPNKSDNYKQTKEKNIDPALSFRPPAPPPKAKMSSHRDARFASLSPRRAGEAAPASLWTAMTGCR